MWKVYERPLSAENFKQIIKTMTVSELVRAENFKNSYFWMKIAPKIRNYYQKNDYFYTQKLYCSLSSISLPKMVIYAFFLSNCRESLVRVKKKTPLSVRRCGGGGLRGVRKVSIET